MENLTIENKQESINAIMVLFLALKEVRLRLDTPANRWSPEQQEKISRIDDKLAGYQARLAELRNG